LIWTRGRHRQIASSKSEKIDGPYYNDLLYTAISEEITNEAGLWVGRHMAISVKQSSNATHQSYMKATAKQCNYG
jgi:hypothetical protein